MKKFVLCICLCGLPFLHASGANSQVEEAEAKPDIASDALGVGVIVADFDGDGLPSIHIADLKAIDLRLDAGIGIATLDVNDDGLSDIVIDGHLYQNKGGEMAHQSIPQLRAKQGIERIKVEGGKVEITEDRIIIEGGKTEILFRQT